MLWIRPISCNLSANTMPSWSVWEIISLQRSWWKVFVTENWTLCAEENRTSGVTEASSISVTRSRLQLFGSIWSHMTILDLNWPWSAVSWPTEAWPSGWTTLPLTAVRCTLWTSIVTWCVRSMLLLTLPLASLIASPWQKILDPDVSILPFEKKFM